MGKNNPKKVPISAAATIAAGKRVPITAALSSVRPPDDDKVVIRWTYFDLRGPWCLGLSASSVIVKLIERLRDIEKMRPNEVFFSGGDLYKEYPVEDLPNQAAKERLTELRFDDQTRIGRLRIDGPGRLYGFRHERYFFALWWDPEHQIWPSPKKHT